MDNDPEKENESINKASEMTAEEKILHLKRMIDDYQNALDKYSNACSALLDVKESAYQTKRKI